MALVQAILMLLQLDQHPPHNCCSNSGKPTLLSGCFRETRRRHSSSNATCTGWSISWKASLGISPSPASAS